MFPGEMVILLSIALSGGSGNSLISRPMDIMNEYIGYLYGSLVRRGYLRKTGSTKYRLTSLGREAMQIFLKENRSKARDIIQALQQLGIESSQMIDELGKELIGVK
ncbi:hypothetical protein ES707_22472 [subsurface metagenome]